MSELTFLKKLLDGSEFQWKTLGDIGDFIRGSGIQKSDFTESGVGCIHYGQIHTHYGTWATETKSFINHDFAVRLRKAHAGDLVVATTSEDDRAVAKAVAWLGNEEVAVSTDAYIYRHTANSKYMSYFFQTELFQSQKKPHITGTKVRRISGDNLAKIQIPIPCPDNPKKSLEIQAEIVRILDAFTELTAELTARKKQYNHYRDQLLRFEEGDLEWKALGDLCSIGVGQAPVGNEPGEYAFVNAGTTPSGYVSAYNTEPNTITTPSRGQGGIGYVGYQTDRFWCGPLCYRIRSTSETLSTRFLYHVMVKATQDIVGLANMTGVPALNKKDLVGFPVPVPSSAEQTRIVAILDKFDALTNSIAEGLPREIELRQKQYAYYRDLLLSFPRPEEVAA